MTRKEWLEKFIELCDTNAKTLDFRRYCRVKAQHLPRHVKRLAEYRVELSKLQEAENVRLAIIEAEAKRIKDEEDRKAMELAETLLRQAEEWSEAADELANEDDEDN